MSKDAEVVVVGAVGIDTNVYLYGNDVDLTVECNFSRNLDHVGQSGGYASRLYAALGKATAFIGFVGDDYHGAYVRNELAADGIDLRGLHVDRAGTKRSVNFMYADGRRKNFYDGKGSMDATPDIDRCRDILRGARLAHFSIVNWTRLLLPAAKELGVTIACDLQDVPSVDDAYRRDFVEQADILLFSAANHADPAPLLRAFRERRVDALLVCGLGARGCAVADASGIRTYPPVDLEEPVIDTNGAGDALAVGFLTGLVLDGLAPDQAALRGQIVARHTCALQATSSPRDLIAPDRLRREFDAKWAAWRPSSVVEWADARRSGNP